MGDGWGQAWRAATACLVLVSCVATARGEGGTCEPWPGEPSPLPTVASQEDAASRWAELRVAELVARAQLAEDADPLESHRLWRRVLCLDPVNQLAWRGLDRTRAVRFYRPVLAWGSSGDEAPATADPWDDLAAPVTVVRARPRPPRPRVAGRRPAPQTREDPPAPRAEPPAPKADPQAAVRAAALERATAFVSDGEESLRGARFAEALGRAAAARESLSHLDRHPEVEPLRARAEVLAATAQVALGDEAGAQESFARALAADPALRLDPMTTSPKVLRVLDAARAAGAGS